MNEKLNVTLLIDNDASMNPHMEKLNQALLEFNKRMNNLPVAINVVTYQGMSPIETPLNKINNGIETGSLPFMSKALNLGYNNFKNKLESKVPEYKSWFIVFTNGRSIDNIEEVVNKIRSDENLGLFFLPIALQKLSYAKVYTNIKEIFKKPITLINYDFEKLFLWLSDLIEERLSKPQEEKLKLSRESLEGWAYL
jgi:uncharacterized protein YegL